MYLVFLFQIWMVLNNENVYLKIYRNVYLKIEKFFIEPNPNDLEN